MNARQFSLCFPFAMGSPDVTASFRENPEDFQVVETLDFEFSGEGEHQCFYIEKTGQNTRWVAGLLAEALGVEEAAVGYCGLKDRRAITRQWFSVHMPGGRDLTVPQLPSLEGCEILKMARHHKKLRRGNHAGNHFRIRLRQVDGDRQLLVSRLAAIAAEGVPNYFGEQRFGREAGNLYEAEKLMYQRSADRSQRRKKTRKGVGKGGLYLSAARSYLFNLVLAERIAQHNWNTCLGDEAMPTGPLWGRGRTQVPEQVRELELRILSDWQDWCHGLEFSGLSQERRQLVLHPQNFEWDWQTSEHEECVDLELSFFLPPGCFATSVLREVANLQQSWAVAE